MAYHPEIGFNSDFSSIMYVDINSCFATIEQQANPLLRHRPVVVVAYQNRNSCVLAASIEAKRLGVKTGMRLNEAKKIEPFLISLPSDPPKYRFIHQSLKTILATYSPQVIARSIDEFVLDFSKSMKAPNLWELAKEIKNKIKIEIGEYLTVSIGIGPSRFLAKTASNLQKPDGLQEINFQNYQKIYSKLDLLDLTGINTRNQARLNSVGVFTVVDFFNADTATLDRAFHSTLSKVWYLRLRGVEVDSLEWSTKSIGHTYTLPKAAAAYLVDAILSKLVDKVGFRLRQSNFLTRGIHLGLFYQNHNYWHKQLSLHRDLYLGSDLIIGFKHLLSQAPKDLVKNISVTCFDLKVKDQLQLDIFDTVVKKDGLSSAIDKIKQRWGREALTQASTMGSLDHSPDSIGFGKI